MNIKEILSIFNSNKNARNIDGMSHFGINTKKAFGLPIPFLRNLAKKIGKNHSLALELWETGYHEARILASFIDEPASVTEKQMDSWVKDFDSWDVCDQCCMGLFDKTKFAYKKAVQWSKSKKEFIKRAGFAMMASLAVHDKKADDSIFEEFYPLIIEGANDERNFVKKAVNWALRQIGKRNLSLNVSAVKTAHDILKLDTKPSRWIANDALRELTGNAVQNRLKFLQRRNSK